jgi:uncharacterized membrane protein
MSSLATLLGVGWPGGHATGASLDGTVVVVLVGTVLFMLAVYEISHSNGHHRR